MATAVLPGVRYSVRELTRREPLAGRAWGLYLFFAFLLVPVVQPPGPGQTSFVDVLNVGALLVFGLVVLAHRLPVRFPFAVPILLISAGSLIAMTNADSMGKALLAIAQDAYLYLWFIMLVALLRGRGDLKPFRLAWVLIGGVVSVLCVVQAIGFHQGFPRSLFSLDGNRAFGTLYNPNMCADFLVLCVFVLAGLRGQVSRALFWTLAGLLAVALLTTKSNGGLVSLAIGFAVWMAYRARVRGWQPALKLAGATAALAGVALLALWLHAGWGGGGAATADKRDANFLSRMSKSSADRGQIWQRLQSSYARTPLGIGPANSTQQPVEVSQQERRGVFVSKEPHSDYVGYAIERGPLAFLALLVLTWQALAMIPRGRKRIEARTLDPRLAVLLAGTLLGAMTATSVHSLVIEKLHFRHFWAFLALAAALTSPLPAEEKS